MDDRALVAALVSGDPRGLEGAYRAYADRLYTYCRGLLRDADAASDAVHDTFVLASQRAGQLRDPERLRSWLYAIARNECLRQLRGRSRNLPLDEAGQVSAPETDPVAGMRAAEIQELVWAAAEGLNPGDREVFELSVRHDLAPPEVSELLGVSVAHAHARLSRARSQLERALGALLVARTGAEECPELAELLRGWDGKLTALVRKRVGRHIESCEVCGERQRRQLSPAALFSAYSALPFLVVPAELWPRLELTSFDPGAAAARAAVDSRAGRFRPDTGFPRPLDLRRRRVAVAGVSAVAVAAVLAFVAGAMIGPPVAPLAGAPDVPSTVAPAVVAPPATSAPAASPIPSVPATATPSPVSTPPPAPAPGAPPPLVPAPGPAPAPPPAPPPGGPPGGPPPGGPPSPTPAPVFTVDASATVTSCSNGVYVVSVAATANLPLASAQVTYQVGTVQQTEAMTVGRSGLTASFETGRLQGAPFVWRVQATGTDGRTASTSPAEIAQPCRQPPQ